ncbi:MAG: acyltransferase family protein [bacterium]
MGEHRRAYRPDIDGLRAVAVLAVVGYHAFPELLSGGFAGVDVFFVISGFLITGLIARELDAGAFSYVRFYERRARRIFPALIVVMLATLAIGWVMLLPEEYARLGEHVAAGTLFSSNLVLWHEVGYFDASAATKPLLHLWSLGIEEQFYLAWPILLVAIWKVGRRRAPWIVLLAVYSFALSIYLVSRNATAAFYSPFTRAWELMIGALLAMGSADDRMQTAWRPMRELASIIGVVMLVGACVELNPRLPYPGWHTLLPTIGAALIIVAGPAAWVNQRVLANRAVVYVGLISYPLYLWHWPLLVFLRLGIESFALQPPRIHALTFGAIAVAFVSAVLTFHLVELPVRRSQRLGVTALRSAAILAATAIVGVVMWRSPHVRLGDDPDVIRAVTAKTEWLVSDIDQGVRYASGSGGEPDIVFIGDSQGERYFPVVQRAAAAMKHAPVVAFATKRACAFVPWLVDDACTRRYRSALRLAMRPSVKRVVIICEWARYVNARFGRLRAGSTLLTRPDGVMASPADVDSAFRMLATDIASLAKGQKDVVFILSPPASVVADPALLGSGSRVPFQLAASSGVRFARSFPLAPFTLQTQWVHGEITMVARLTGARTIDPAEFLCARGDCMAEDEAGRPLRSDASHLREFASIRYLTFVPSLLDLPVTTVNR